MCDQSHWRLNWQKSALWTRMQVPCKYDSATKVIDLWTGTNQLHGQEYKFHAEIDVRPKSLTSELAEICFMDKNASSMQIGFCDQSHWSLNWQNSASSTRMKVPCKRGSVTKVTDVWTGRNLLMDKNASFMQIGFCDQSHWYLNWQNSASSTKMKVLCKKGSVTKVTDLWTGRNLLYGQEYDQFKFRYLNWKNSASSTRMQVPCKRYL